MRLMKLMLIIIFVCIIGWKSKDVSKIDCECDKFTIELRQVFKQKETMYGVLFFLDGCTACRNTKLFLQKDCELFVRKFYYVSLESNEIPECDENYSNVGCTDYKNIKILMGPTLLIIENYAVINQLIGYQKIVNYYTSS